MEDNSHIKRPDNNRQIVELILNDKELRKLNDLKAEIYANSIPKVIIVKGEAKQVWSEQVVLKINEIDKMISFRKQQIISFYENR